MRKFLRWLYRVGSRVKARDEIELLQEGIAIIRGTKRVAFIPLAKIERVTAFKRDLLTVDLICIAVDFKGETGSGHIELNEEMEGFEPLLSQFEQTPGFLSEWRKKIIVPPFNTNATVLWERRQASDHLIGA